MSWKTLISRPLRACLRRWFRRPFNHARGSYSAENIDRDVDYALQVGRNYLGWLGGLGSGPALRGLRVLELGPGINFGASFYLAAHGALPAVADRFLAEWDPGYHPGFYERLRDRIQKEEPHLDTAPLTACLHADGHLSSVIAQHRRATEELDVPAASLDLVISNAVLEHLYDHAEALRRLWRMTRPGGWNLHQVDFRYHPHWDTPLEHLLFTRAQFDRLSQRAHCEHGTTLRPFELTRMFEATGFRCVEFHANEMASEAYFTDFLGRLREQEDSPYVATPEADLRPLGGLYKVRR